MPARIALGDHSPIESTGYDRARRRTRRGRKAEQWRARARFRVLDGTVVEVTRWAPIRSDAEHAVQTALDDLARASADTPLRPGLAFLEAGRFWLQQIQRPEYDLAQRTKQDYQRAFNRYLAIESSPFRALTLAQANDVQRVVGYLQRIADKHGSGAAKLTRTVLSSIFALAVQRGVLEVNAARVGGPVKASSPRPSPRDRRRSMTRVERDRVIALADSWARADGVNPRTADKWQTVADLIALMAGTGCRINEARLLKWDDVDLGNGRLQIHGTKSVAADRVVNLPALVATIEQALARGWQLADLITAPPDGADVDDCQALLWRTSVLLDPLPDTDPRESPIEATKPAETPTWASADAAAREPDWALVEPPADDEPLPDPANDATGFAWPPATAAASADHTPIDEVEPDLALTWEAIERRALTPPEMSAADLNALLDRADAWRASPHTPERLAAVNAQALEFYQACYRGSWAQPYLTERFGADLSGDPDIRPGYAPAGWTTLVTHLHRHGVTDDELLATGLAVTASTERLIDRFRDRALFPIFHDHQVLGFVGRRHPDATDLDHAGPKYLNTAETLLFHKRAQLFVAGARHLDAGGIPVVVEGPADAIAVTHASAGRYVGVAPLGTNLTSEQAVQLRGLGVDPIIATDADIAGQVAAHRDYWILTPHLLQPRHAALPEGTDPADLVATGNARQLLDALDHAGPLAHLLINERLANLPPADAALAAAVVIAAQPVEAWEPGVHAVAERIGVDADVMRGTVLPFVRAWNHDPGRLADQQLALTAGVRDRLAAAATARRWENLAARIDPRLVGDPAWRHLAAALQEADDRRVDVPGAIAVGLQDGPLDPAAPAADLANRLDRLTHPEPFTGSPTTGHIAEEESLNQAHPTRSSTPVTW